MAIPYSKGLSGLSLVDRESEDFQDFQDFQDFSAFSARISQKPLPKCCCLFMICVQQLQSYFVSLY